MTGAHAQLRSFFQRWQRLEEEKKAVADDLKALFAEMKGVGFDTKAARAVFRDGNKDHGEVAEKQAMYDLYWNALFSSQGAESKPENPTGTEPATQARDAREAETHDPETHDPETGEITESVGASLSDPHGADKSGSPVVPDPQVHAVSGAEPSIPSSDAAGAKSGGGILAAGQAGVSPGIESRQSEQGTTELTQDDIPAFLRRSDGYQKKAASQ